jgi:hypothetical protein
VVEEKDWEKNEKRTAPNKTVKVRILYGEVNLGRLVKSAGARWII